MSRSFKKPGNNLKYNKKTDQEAGYSARIKATEGIMLGKMYI